MNFIDEYITKLIEDLSKLLLFNKKDIEKVIGLIIATDKAGGEVYIIGNGGSSSTAQHFAQGLCDAGVVAWSLSDNMALTTALGNDKGYENIYYDQLVKILGENDLVIGISGSGNSSNIVKAIEYAGAQTVCLLGFDGGKLKDICKNVIWVKDNNYGRVEDVHLTLAHIISLMVKEANGVK